MKRLLVALALCAASVAATATCMGSDSFQTCTDSSGNSYTVNRMGDMTIMNGYNSQTGTSWNQTSTTMGDMTIHNGTAGNGNSWSGTTQRIGDMQIHSGTDSRGRSYYRTCSSIGCN